MPHLTDFFKLNPKRIYLAVDFPANMDITNDFVCVIGYEKEEFLIYAIPYNTETGETFSEIEMLKYSIEYTLIYLYLFMQVFNLNLI